MRDIAIVVVTIAGIFVGIHFYDKLVPQASDADSETQIEDKAHTENSKPSAETDSEWEELDEDQD